ncbi:unnamed protein product [Sphenostylis stenocarpa]|uniref:Uncharacterized protein n=1 Tax=Sphenostylis stenocarpa TaxID=92480 RepID=A0AA86VFK7_9FABA|nr:unnamed protein product [Sphenostylis stenocarpa]
MTWKRLKLSLKKLLKENKEKEMTLYMFQSLETRKLEEDDNITMADLNVLSSVIEKNLMNINERLDTLDANEMMTPSQTQMQPPTPAAEALEETKLVNDDDVSADMTADGDLHNGGGDNLQL